MIKDVDDRLTRWAQQVIDDNNQGGFGSSLIGLLMVYGGILVRGTAPDNLPLDAEAHEMEQIIKKLDTYHRETIGVYYLKQDLSKEQKAKELHCSVPTLYRRLQAAHVLIEDELKKLRMPNSYTSY